MRHTLIIMRHGEAQTPRSRGSSDHERPLTEKGRLEAGRTTKSLIEAGASPDLMLVSDAARARETAAIVRDGLSQVGDVRTAPRLYLAHHAAILAELAHQADGAHSCVMIVGHNPGLSEIVEHLTGVEARLSTAEAVRLTVEASSWAEAAQLTGVWDLAGQWRP